jgi:hypothetical protein
MVKDVMKDGSGRQEARNGIVAVYMHHNDRALERHGVWEGPLGPVLKRLILF